MEVPPLDGTDWAEQVAGWMRSYRRALAAHPNLIPLLTEHTMTGGSVLRGYDRVATLLGRAGVPVHEVLLWISVFDCYALGAALDLAAPDDVWQGEVGELPALDEAIGAAPRGRRRGRRGVRDRPPRRAGACGIASPPPSAGTSGRRRRSTRSWSAKLDHLDGAGSTKTLDRG